MVDYSVELKFRGACEISKLFIVTMTLSYDYFYGWEGWFVHNNYEISKCGVLRDFYDDFYAVKCWFVCNLYCI